jgi:hypothetical protein
MTEISRIPAPAGLERRGRRLWRDVSSAYKLRPDELVLLETACKCVDLIDRLETEMAGQPLTVVGSAGQQREHPLLSEQRLQRTLLRQSLSQLKLPDLREGAAVNQNRAAGMTRWARAHGEHPGNVL